MKKRILSVLLVCVLMMTTLTGCNVMKALNANSNNSETEELQAQLEALQEELDALKAETEEASGEETEEVVEDVTEEETEEVVEEETEEVVEEDTTTANVEMSADWTDYTVNVNGTDITLPCTYQELSEATGFVMKSSDEKSYLEAGYYSNINLYTADESLALYIEVLNDTEEDQTYADCTITSISQTDYQANDKGAAMVTFAGGLQVGQEMTTDELEAIFGAPSDTYEYISDDTDYPYESYTWTYAEDPDYTSHNKLEVVIVNGVIDQIEIDYLYYE